MKAENIGDRIKLAMNNSGLSAPKLAQKAKMSTSLLHTYLNNTSKPGADYLLVLSKILNISIDWLVTGEDIPQKKAEVITDPDLEFAIQLLTDLYQHPNPNMRGWAKVQFYNAFENEIEKKKQGDISTIA